MANKKILIVDDDPDVLQGMHVRLKANQYGTFVLQWIRSLVWPRPRRSEPDLILLDLGLPAGWRFHGDGKTQTDSFTCHHPRHCGLGSRRSWKPESALSMQGRRPFFKSL
jgi:DNA-binding NtrC family response regulator